MASTYSLIEDAGDSAPWLVMVHGISQNHRVFSAQSDAFRNRYRIQLIDLPGHGLSADVPGPFGHAEMARHVREAMDAAGIEVCHYWGTHTGTALGLLLSIANPQRFASLVLEGAVLPGQAMPSVEAELQRARDTARRQGVAAARRQWFDLAPWFDVIRARPEECRAAAHWDMISEFAGTPWLYKGPAQAVAHYDRQYADLDLPVLLYNGAHDLPDFFDNAEFLAARLPRVRRETIAGGGGFPAWEFPDRVNALVASFLDAV